jgi:hypothetical protein
MCTNPGTNDLFNWRSSKWIVGFYRSSKIQTSPFRLTRTQGAQFLVPVVCYPMFKPYEVHDEHERLEIDHKIYLQSPELRRHILFWWIPFHRFSLELNDLLHEAAFKGGLSRSLSVSPDMMKKLSHRQVNHFLNLWIADVLFLNRCTHFIRIIIHRIE